MRTNEQITKATFLYREIIQDNKFFISQAIANCYLALKSKLPEEDMDIARTDLTAMIVGELLNFDSEDGTDHSALDQLVKSVKSEIEKDPDGNKEWVSFWGLKDEHSPVKKCWNRNCFEPILKGGGLPDSDFCKNHQK